MIIKKFIGKNEEEATALAKKDLGDNLVIMNVRKVKAKPPFAFLKGKKVEVTAAVEEEDPGMEQIRRIARAQVSAQ
ncbi:MAG: flagellar biosynthesis protein FlhF, partial [Lachnospiraceae bacterium]|nr:flagellar biosynthesis protein FlhF [Lachnospiraceae bacterium]